MNELVHAKSKYYLIMNFGKRVFLGASFTDHEVGITAFNFVHGHEPVKTSTSVDNIIFV